MNKLRCPNCGELSINGTFNAVYKFSDFDDLLFKQKGHHCPKCNKPYYLRHKYTSLMFWLASIVEALSFIPMIVLIFYKLWFLSLLIFVADVVLSIFLYQNRGLVGVDPDDYRAIEPVSNVSLMLKNVKMRTENLDILTIKFDKSTLNVRFMETFERGHVPVMFLRRKCQNTYPVDAYIFKTEFIPDELFFVGSTFKVYNNKYEIIANGTIEKIYS